MFGKYLLPAFVAIFLCACAQPKYEQKAGSDHSPGALAESADCSVRFNRSENCLWWKWEKYPTESEPGLLVFKVYRLNSYDGSAVLIDPSAELDVVLWMPSMGHGSTPTTVSRLDVGTYRASEVFFIMPGEWEMKFQAKDNSGATDEVIVPLTF